MEGRAGWRRPLRWSDCWSLAAAEVVHEDHIAWLQLRHEHLVDIGLERTPIHWAVEHHRGRDPVPAQAGHEGGRLPVPVRDGGSQPLASVCPPTEPGHVGGGPRLVDEDQPFRVELDLSFEPFCPSPQDVISLLLGRVGGLFLNVRPARSRKVQIVPTDADMPASLKSRSCISPMVMSGSASIRPSK